jgi:glycosyltransferase involved in cell wall biosynthesis
MAPRISIMLPCRDAEDTLAAALESISGQTFEDFEIVAVDDGSLDGTWSLLQELAWRERRLRPLRRPRLGLVPALEAAQVYARGALLARMDADDLAEPERLALQVARLDACPDVAACGTHVRYFPREALGEGALRYERWLNGLDSPASVERQIFVECPLAHPTLMVRRAALLAVDGYRDMGWPEDYDLLLRLWASGRKLAVVPQVLLRWRESATRASRADARYAPAAFRRCKVHYLQRTLAAGRAGIVVWGAGPVGKAFARELLAQGLRLRAFVDLDPRKIGQEIHGVQVVAPDAIDRFRGALAVAAVGSPGARHDIRAALDAAGWQEMVDYCAVA